MPGEVPDTPWIREVREDLCRYTGLAPEAVDRYFRRAKGYRIRNEFDAFGPRGEDELTRRSKGTGLGLALVKGLAEHMGAAIQGRNVPEGGFEVRLAFQGGSSEA